MAGIIPSIVLEDSKANKFFFYYRDSSICYKEIPASGGTKDTVLISQANADFAAAADTDDTICLACNSRHKGILLFTYSADGWKFETIVNIQNSADMYIMDMVIMNGAIHIFFLKKLSLSVCNVYHLQRSINDRISYTDYSWRKNSLSEIYPHNIEGSYSILPLKNSIIHYASIWHDGINCYINYYCYDDSIKSWLHKNLNIYYKSHVSIKLILHNKKINLFCFSYENGTGEIRHFLGKYGSINEIDFKEISNISLDTGGVTPLFQFDEKAIQMAWIKENVFHQYIFDDSSGKWKKSCSLPITAGSSIHILKMIKNPGVPVITKGYYIIDEKYNILRPAGYLSKDTVSDKHESTNQLPEEPCVNECMKQILSEIKDLSDNVQFLRNRVESLEGRTFVESSPSAKAIYAAKNVPDHPKIRKSDFKEKFMKSENTPNFESLSMRQSNINTYIGKPEIKTLSGEAYQEIKSNSGSTDNEKKAYAASVSTALQNSGVTSTDKDGTQNKNNTLLKKIGSYFK